MRPGPRWRRAASLRRRAARGALLLAFVLVAACAGAPPLPRDSVPYEASSALARAHAFLRGGRDALSLERAAEAAEEALRWAPGWVAPQRLLDDLNRDQLLGVASLEAHRQALQENARDAGRLYLAGRLEGAEGHGRFQRAASLEPELAWAWHGLAWSARLEGDLASSVRFERRAYDRARDSWERSYFASTLARFFGEAGDNRRQIEVLAERLAQTDVHESDRLALAVGLARAEMQWSYGVAAERGYQRGLGLLHTAGLTADELALLVHSMVESATNRSRSQKLQEIGLGLASREGPGRALLRAELLLEERASPLALELLERSRRASGLEGRPPGERRALYFAIGRPWQAIDSWLGELPAVVLEGDGLPKERGLRRVASLAQQCEAEPDDAELREAMGAALIEVGWFEEARAFADWLAGRDLEAALALETRAAAGRALLAEIARLVRSVDASSPLPERDELLRSNVRSPARGRTLDDLADLLGAMEPAFGRYRGLIFPEQPRLLAMPDLGTSPLLDYGPAGAVVHPGPRFSAADQRARLGREGARVGGLARELERLGRFGLFGQGFSGGPDGTLLRLVHVEVREGEHLGVPWRGTVAWCEGADLESRPGRRGARIGGAALHEGYWIDIQTLRAEHASWLALEERYFGAGEPLEVEHILALEGLSLPARPTNGQPDRSQRARLSPPLGEGERVRLAVLYDRWLERRVSATGEGPLVGLDEVLEATAIHEEGHLCDRSRFLPLADNFWRVFRFLARDGFAAGRVELRLEYRAQLTALCAVVDPRLPLAEILLAAEGSGGPTPHARAYTELLEDFLRVLDHALTRAPEGLPVLDADRSLVHQLHRLGPEEVRSLARELAAEEGLLVRS